MAGIPKQEPESSSSSSSSSRSEKERIEAVQQEGAEAHTPPTIITRRNKGESGPTILGAVKLGEGPEVDSSASFSAELEIEPLIDPQRRSSMLSEGKDNNDSYEDLGESKGSSIWPGGSFSAFLKSLTTRQLALWLFLASLIGGGIAAVVVTFGFPALTVVGIPSILGLGGIAVPLILVSVVGALVTLATLMILERYITDKKTPFGLFIALVALSGIAFAALGLFVVATTPGLLGALTFGAGPYVPFVIAGVGLGVLAMVGAGIAYGVINNRKVGAGEPGPSLGREVPQIKDLRESLELVKRKDMGLESRRQSFEAGAADGPKPLPPVEEFLQAVKQAKEQNASIESQLALVEQGLQAYPQHPNLAHKKAVLLCFRGRGDDYLDAATIFRFLNSPVLGASSRLLRTNQDENMENIADQLDYYVRIGKGSKEDKQEYAGKLMRQVEKELKSPSFAKGKKEIEKRKDALSLYVFAAQKLDPANNQYYQGLLGNISKEEFKQAESAIAQKNAEIRIAVERKPKTAENIGRGIAIESLESKATPHAQRHQAEALPPGWEEHHTEGGETYYWHEATETSVWERYEIPNALEDAESQSHDHSRTQSPSSRSR